MTSTDNDILTPDEAAALVTAAAFTTGEGRRIIHTFVETLGADWDLQDALRFIAEARDIRWRFSMLGHELRVAGYDGRPVQFDVRRPTA